MKIYCASTPLGDNLEAFRKYVGKDIWMMCNRRYTDNLGDLIRIIEIKDNYPADGHISIRYRDIPINVDKWEEALEPPEIFDDVKDYIYSDAGIKESDIAEFSVYIQVYVPEELYSTEELMERFYP